MKLTDIPGVPAPVASLNEHYFPDADIAGTAHPRRGNELTLEQIHRLRKIKDRNIAEYKQRLKIVGLVYNQPEE